MVEDTITDGRRIAQLLASELTGLDAGPIDDVSVSDADTDAEPDQGGALAYRIALGGDAVADVRITEASACVAVTDRSLQEALSRDTTTPGLSIEDGEDGPVLVVERGASVKTTLDVLADAIVTADADR